MDGLANMERNSLCICIPTYNRCTVVMDFLKNCAKYYLDAGIDIYIYDSSTDNRTEQEVEEWKKVNSERIYYVRMPSEMHANIKVYKIWQFYGLQRDYDFIWLCGDALQFSESAIDIIMNYLRREYDILELDVFGKDEIGYKLYSDENELFAENAWKMTLFGNTILNTHTFLKNVDWDRYEDKYLKPDIINYSHVSFYFNRILELMDFNCIHIPLDKYYTQSKYKVFSGWRKETFFVICVGWVKTVKKLPDHYFNKKKVIKDLAINSVLINELSFRELKRERIYGFIVFLRYLLEWEKICDVRIRKLFYIALLPYNMGVRWTDAEWGLKLKRIRNIYRSIYLYGAGITGARYGKYLTENGIIYEGYLVTKPSTDQKELNDHPVIGIDQLEADRNIGIIIAVADKTSEEIKSVLTQHNYGKQVYYSKELSDWIWYYMENWKEYSQV